MLVLSRRKDESLMIGDLIEVFIVDIRGDKVRLGIQAPMDVAVHRHEFYKFLKQQEAEQQATQSPPSGD